MNNVCGGGVGRIPLCCFTLQVYSIFDIDENGAFGIFQGDGIITEVIYLENFDDLFWRYS